VDAPKILIIEDEAKIRKVLRAYLIREGYAVREIGDGEEGLRILEAESFDLLLLDLMLPGLSGEKVAAAVRQRGNTPVLIVSAKSEEWERLRGFDLGADDYIIKPFSPREVVARVKAVLRRSGGGLPSDRTVIDFPGFSINPETREVIINDDTVSMTATEFDLLYAMAGKPGRVFRRTQLASIVLGYEHEAYGRTIDSHIKNLRKKLGNLHESVQTVYGVGYRFSPPVKQ